jgi:hypothetical protein
VNHYQRLNEPARHFDGRINQVINTQAKYNRALPQLQGGLFLTGGGLEMTLVFHDGIGKACVH